MQLDPGTLNRRVRIEQKQEAQGFDSAGSGAWGLVAEVWAEVQDVLPSRGERQDNIGTIATRPARVRMRYRSDITAAMRLVMGTRVMQIVSGPAEIGFREGIELMAEEYSTAGTGA